MSRNVNVVGAAEYARQEKEFGGNWAEPIALATAEEISASASTSALGGVESAATLKADIDFLFDPKVDEFHFSHWEKPMKKTIFTLNIGNYEPAVCALTYPLMKHYAQKIGADFCVINERAYPEWPVVYEKLQVFELAKRQGNDWNFFIDSDALINPEMFDPTDHIAKDTVMFNGKDMAGVRWSYDQYFRRDGRHIGACNWMAIASDWCLDLWRPLDDLTPEEAFRRIHITTNEYNSGMFTDNHLIDDYTLSRNIARFGLKHRTFQDLCGELGWKAPRIANAPSAVPNVPPTPVAWGESAVSPFLFHLYAIPADQKIRKLLDVLSAPIENGGWALMSAEQRKEFEQKWGVK